MALRLEEASYADIHGIIDCLFDAYSDPYHPFFDLLVPGAGRNAPEGKPPAAERFLSAWKANPFERWVKVIDCDADRIVGTSRWGLYSEPPFPNGPPHVEATNLPEGSIIREYATYIINDRLERQAARCRVPNVWLGTMAVGPSHRRCGVASMMMQWGVNQATEMDVEMFVEASWYGSQVYRRFGFQYIDKFRPKRPLEMEGNAEWDVIESEYPFEGEWLWRPRPKKIQEPEKGLRI